MTICQWLGHGTSTGFAASAGFAAMILADDTSTFAGARVGLFGVNGKVGLGNGGGSFFAPATAAAGSGGGFFLP